MIAGIAIAAVGAGAGTLGVYKGIKNIGKLKAAPKAAVVDPWAGVTSGRKFEPRVEFPQPQTLDEAGAAVREAYTEVLFNRGKLIAFEDGFRGLGGHEATALAKKKALLSGGLNEPAMEGTKLHFYQQEYSRVAFEVQKNRMIADININDIL